MQAKEYSLRRRQLMQQMGKGSVAILFAASECQRTGTTTYPYRQDSDFYYLTGFDEPEAVMVLIPERVDGEFILFCREHDVNREILEGKRAGQEGACKEYGADQAYPITELDNIMPKLLAGNNNVYFKIGLDAELDAKVFQWVRQLKSGIRDGVQAPKNFISLEGCLHAMRLRKSAAEIATMRQAATISAKAHLRAMQVCAPGMYEYELEAELLHVFTKHGGRFTAFESIVGGGSNACTLHYSKNNEQLIAGEMVLIDAGVEYEYYSADITRTYPVNGKFSPEQKLIYQAVLDAQLAVISIVKPGTRWNMLQETAERVITERLVALGILHGNVDQLFAAKAYKPFFMHRIGHWLGMECHDVGEYKLHDGWRVLEPGIVLTVEPGIYICAENTGVDAKWHNIGIRIEDNVLVTANGCEVLTADVPKEIGAIETIMQYVAE